MDEYGAFDTAPFDEAVVLTRQMALHYFMIDHPIPLDLVRAKRMLSKQKRQWSPELKDWLFLIWLVPVYHLDKIAPPEPDLL